MPITRVLLSAYMIRIRKKHQKAKYAKLDSFDGSKDFLDVLNTFLKDHLQLQQHDATAKHLMNLQRFDPGDRKTTGIILSGQYGQACDIYDAQKAEYTYTKNKNEADMLPFYFQIEIPSDADEGFLIVQRSTHGGGGIKTDLVKNLSSHFETQYPDMKLEFNPLMPEEVVKSSISKGEVLKVTFIHFGLPSDIAERYGPKHKERHGSMELTFKAKRNDTLPLKQDVLNFIKKKTGDVSGFYELKNMDFDVHQVKVKVRLGKQTRTVNLADIQSSPIYDVTKDVKFSEVDGNVTYDSIDEAADGIAEMLKAGIYGETVHDGQN